MAIILRIKRKPLFPHFTSNSIAYDTEATGLIPYGRYAYWGYEPARPFAFSFCDGDGHTGYFRFCVDPMTRRVIPEPEGMAILHRLHSEPQFEIIGHNIAYDFRMGTFLGVKMRQRMQVIDTMVLAHIVTGGDELLYALKPLSKKYLRFPDDDEKELEEEVKAARKIAKANGWMIAIGHKEMERGDKGVFAGSKPIKADYWLVPSPDTRNLPNDHDIDPDDPDVDKTQRYAIGDVLRAQMLKQLWMPELEAEPRLANTFRREMNLFWALRRMELRGTRTYPEHIDYLIGWYNRYMKKQRKIADANGGRGMNFNSPKQLTTKFYDERGVTPVVFTPKGQMYWDMAGMMDPFDLESTVEIPIKKSKKIVMVPMTQAQLEAKAKQHRKIGKDQLANIGGYDEDTNTYREPLAGAILEYRAAHQSIKSFLKIYRTFYYPETLKGFDLDEVAATDVADTFLSIPDDEFVKWSEVWKDSTWVLHPNYNQTGAITGRMTCSDPNLQQVASATTGLRKAQIPARPRECFGPRPGYVWYLPDYSQIEVWLFAFMSGEKSMQQLLLDGHDFHQGVADKSFIHKPDYKERKKYYRKLSKLIMFGKLYGGGVGTPEKPGRMTNLLQQPFEQTKEFIDSFEEQFASVKIWSKKIIKQIRADGKLWNTYGRQYILGHDHAYKGVNYNIQGTAADALKVATIRLDYLLNDSGRWNHPGLCLLNSIHDEFIIEVPWELHSQRLMREIMWVMQMDSRMMGIPVPLPVGMKIATKRWSHTKDINIPGMRLAGDNWVFGGVPRDDGPFDDLRRAMQACPS